MSVTSRLLDETHKDAEKVRQGLASLDMDFVLELQVYYDELVSKCALRRVLGFATTFVSTGKLAILIRRGQQTSFPWRWGRQCRNGTGKT